MVLLFSKRLGFNNMKYYVPVTHLHWHISSLHFIKKSQRHLYTALESQPATRNPQLATSYLLRMPATIICYGYPLRTLATRRYLSAAIPSTLYASRALAGYAVTVRVVAVCYDSQDLR